MKTLKLDFINARSYIIGLNENPIKFFLFKQIYFFDIQHIIRLLILSNFNNLVLGTKRIYLTFCELSL